MLKRRPKRTSGNAIAELPGSLFIFFIGLLFPLIGVITLSYRAILLYNGIRDACYQAAIEQSYGEAKSKAAAILLKDTVDVPGIKLDAAQPKIQIVVKKLSGGAETLYTVPLAAGSVNTTVNSYFIRATVSADIVPLINFGGNTYWNTAIPIPGLTAPIRITGMMYQVYAENPNGLET